LKVTTLTLGLSVYVVETPAASTTVIEVDEIAVTLPMWRGGMRPFLSPFIAGAPGDGEGDAALCGCVTAVVGDEAERAAMTVPPAPAAVTPAMTPVTMRRLREMMGNMVWVSPRW
jgi:hypothetical protein